MKLSWNDAFRACLREPRLLVDMAVKYFISFDDLIWMERLFNSLAPFCVEHFFPKANLQRRTAKSFLVLQGFLLHESDNPENFSKVSGELGY